MLSKEVGVMVRKTEGENRGFTLIELVVAMLVAGFVMAAVMVFVSVGLRQYGMTSTDVALQMEGQTALNQVSDILMTGTEYPSLVRNLSVGGKTLKVYGFDSAQRGSGGTVTRQCELFVLDAQEKLLLTDSLSEDAVKAYLGTEEEEELPADKSLTSQLFADEDARKRAAAVLAGADAGGDDGEADGASGTDSGDRSHLQKYLLANNIGDFSMETVRDLNGKPYTVKITVTAEQNGKTRAVSGAYRVRNSTWNNSPVVSK